MSRRFSLQILLPIDGYEEGKIYKKEDIELRETYYNQKPDNVYYIRLKKESVYASIEDILEFVKNKYSLDRIEDYSMQIHRFGEYEINFQGNKYIVEKDEVKQLEKVHIDEAIYCNEFKCCSLSWFYTSVGSELVPDDSVIVDDELIKKAANLLDYESEKTLANGLADVLGDNASGEDKFMVALILAKEIANRMHGRAFLKYDWLVNLIRCRVFVYNSNIKNKIRYT